MLLHSLTNFEIQKYYEYESKFNDVYSRNNLSKIKDGAYVISLHQYKSVKTQWKDLYVNADKHIPKEIKKFIGNKIIIINTHWIQGYGSAIYRYFCVGFTAKRQTFARLYKFIFSSQIWKEWWNNCKIFLVTKKIKMKDFVKIVLFVVSIENLKTLKYHTFLKNISSFYYLK